MSNYQPPKGLLKALENPRSQTVGRQEFPVNLDWWQRSLMSTAVQPSIRGTTSGTIPVRRRDVFALSAAAKDSPDEAIRLLWTSTAWGTGIKPRLCAKRIESVKKDPNRLGEELALIAAMAKDEPIESYRRFKPSGKTLIRYLGPAFFTKYLYFAAGDQSNNPHAILDARVSKRLKALNVLHLGPHSWSASQYESYLNLLAGWRDSAASTLGRPVRLDEIEFWLFEGS